MKKQDMLLIAGCAVLLIAATIYFWPTIRRSREGFQGTGALSVPPSIGPPTPETCALMKSISEQVNSKYQKAVDEDNKLVIDLMKQSVESIRAEITKMGC